MHFVLDTQLTFNRNRHIMKPGPAVPSGSPSIQRDPTIDRLFEPQETRKDDKQPAKARQRKKRIFKISMFHH